MEGSVKDNKQLLLLEISRGGKTAGDKLSNYIADSRDLTQGSSGSNWSDEWLKGGRVRKCKMRMSWMIKIPRESSVRSFVGAVTHSTTFHPSEERDRKISCFGKKSRNSMMAMMTEMMDGGDGATFTAIVMMMMMMIMMMTTMMIMIIGTERAAERWGASAQRPANFFDFKAFLLFHYQIDIT